MNICAIIPTYNNAGTIIDVVNRTLDVLPDVIVVNDGCTDSTQHLLEELSARRPFEIIRFEYNRGKGAALRSAFALARQKGYDYAVTLDGDGQHYPEDIPLLTNAVEEFLVVNPHRDVLVVGSRNLNADGMPQANTFANKFSNFWFAVQTFRRLPDTQTGFRAYPLRALPRFGVTNRYESELALLVLSAWRGVALVPQAVRVYYPPSEERVSHFRPFADFFRISVLNTLLCLVAIVYGYPSMLVNGILRGSRKNGE
ncbi:MAG: glycosyltransferase family 2 protein [Bacteroidales bacterium]|nr:glycosyltransferase family 2 protein [Bacteroidales bacterium]